VTVRAVAWAGESRINFVVLVHHVLQAERCCQAFRSHVHACRFGIGSRRDVSSQKGRAWMPGPCHYMSFSPPVLPWSQSLQSKSTTAVDTTPPTSQSSMSLAHYPDQDAHTLTHTGVCHRSGIAQAPQHLGPLLACKSDCCFASTHPGAKKRMSSTAALRRPQNCISPAALWNRTSRPLRCMTPSFSVHFQRFFVRVTFSNCATTTLSYLRATSHVVSQTPHARA